MASSKTEAFTAGDVRLAAWAKALAHPARLAILRVLAARRACLCGEIVDELPLAQSTVSQHLRALREAGLVAGEVEGPRVCYCLDEAALREMRQAMTALLDDLEPTTDCC